MPNTRPLVALAIVALLAGPASAAESLLEIYQRALQNDPTIREAEAQYRAQAEAKPQARASLLPALSLGGTVSNQYSDTKGGVIVGGSVLGSRSVFDSDTHGWTVNLTQTIFDWGQYTTLRQADKRVLRAETDYEAAKQALLIRVATAYFNVLASKDALASAVSAREAIARQLEQAQRRFEVGLIAITDVQQSQAGYDDSVAAEIQAQRVLATSYEQLREIIGDMVTDVAAPTDQLPLLSPDPASPEQWVKTALSQNLALVSTRIAAEVADYDIQIQKGSRLPKVNLQASYSTSMSDRLSTLYQGTQPPFIQNIPQKPEGHSWQINMQFPLFTGGLNRSRIEQAVYTHRAASEELERIARQTERQTRDAYLGVISEISRVRALKQSVESNRTALRATEAGFEVGTQTTVDVLTAQKNLSAAETSYSQSRYSYILNVLTLKQAAGNLSVTDVEQVDGWLH
ncbi:MAG TPA: TolC family outer membrane protein [Gammaproteobacteria bacterium]|jgi:outer membrane protein|nr:TolC family outer membrane protein [Gammaproteobacteria bacterium]